MVAEYFRRTVKSFSPKKVRPKISKKPLKVSSTASRLDQSVNILDLSSKLALFGELRGNYIGSIENWSSVQTAATTMQHVQMMVVQFMLQFLEFSVCPTSIGGNTIIHSMLSWLRVYREMFAATGKDALQQSSQYEAATPPTVEKIEYKATNTESKELLRVV